MYSPTGELLLTAIRTEKQTVKKKEKKRKSERRWSADVFNSNPKNGAAATVLTTPLSINKKLEEKKKSIMTTDFKHPRPH